MINSAAVSSILFVTCEHFPLSDYAVGVTAPPFHCRCRTTTCPYFDDEFTLGEERAARGTDDKTHYVDGNIKYKDWHSKYIKDNQTNNDSKKSSGAIGKIHKNDYERKQKHAKTYYNSIRKRNDDIESISNNTGINKNTIGKVKEHIFLNKYDLEEGYTNFYPDYEMSLAWQRLIEGKNIKKSDIVLLNHERLESCLMNRYNYVYEDAHNITCRKYNYIKALREE